MFKGIFAVAVMALLSACAYQSSAPVTPAYDVYTSYSEKLPGRYALYITTDGLSKDANKGSYVCSAHTFPVDAEYAFGGSVRQTVEQIVEQAELVTIPLGGQELRNQGFTGLIRVDPREFNPRISFQTGFWSGTGDAKVDLAIGVSVEGHQGRVFGTSVGSTGNADGDSGGACENGSNILAEATSQALRRVMERMAERMANSQPLRAYAYAVNGREQPTYGYVAPMGSTPIQPSSYSSGNTNAYGAGQQTAPAPNVFTGERSQKIEEEPQPADRPRNPRR